MGKLPWNEKSTSFLIQLYSENIKNFMHPNKSQINLWRRLVELMKQEEDEGLPQDFKDKLTAGHAQRKWINIRQRFKDAFYDEDLQVHFPYFHRMNEMFTEFATSQLSSRMNETTQEEVSAFVNDLLQNSSFEIDALRCASNDMNELPSNPVPRQSEATKVRQYIAKLPRESISVSQASLRIQPNTPFNRKYQLSTIVNNKSNFMTNLKRSPQASPEELKPKKAHLAFEPYENFEEQDRDVTIIESLDETFLAQEWKVESLDECELSGIHGQPIKIEPARFVPKLSKKFDPRGTIDQVQLKKSLNTPFGQQRNISVSRTSLQTDSSVSILEVPPLPSINILEVETLPSLSSIVQTPGPNETLRAAPDVRVIPKTLNFTKANASNSCTLNDLSQPPQWFQSFVTRYDADMSKINTKMDSITKKLDKIIEQTNFD